jgi:hypothetical protein
MGYVTSLLVLQVETDVIIEAYGIREFNTGAEGKKVL